MTAGRRCTEPPSGGSAALGPPGSGEGKSAPCERQIAGGAGAGAITAPLRAADNSGEGARGPGGGPDPEGGHERGAPKESG